MSVVATGLRPSVPVAAKPCKDLPVSVQKLYGKIRRTPPLSGTSTGAAKCGPLGRGVDSHMKDKAPTVSGYPLRIVGGHHLPPSKKRLKRLRGFRGAALPGQSLLVYDRIWTWWSILVPCEDAQAQEHA
jgi:hypothetical protein